MEVQTLKHPAIRNFVAGQLTTEAPGKTLNVFNPLSGELISTVPLSGAVALDAAVQAAKSAFPAWAAVPIKEKVQIFYRYKTLLERDMKALADLVREENGKTFDEARAEVEKAIELTEFAYSMPQLIGGEALEVSKGVEFRLFRLWARPRLPRSCSAALRLTSSATWRWAAPKTTCWYCPMPIPT